MSPAVGDLVLPGDIIDVEESTGTSGDPSSSASSRRRLDLGPGLQRVPSVGCRVTQPGVWRSRPPHLHWVDSCSRRYIAVRGQCVIGQVTARLFDHFLVDIGCSQSASLSYLAFEGATKKNRPRVQIGDLVLAKLLVDGRHAEPELVCVNSHGKSDGLGVLTAENALDVRVSLHVCRRLLSPNSPLLASLGRHVRFEIAVGLNGRVWVRADTIQHAAAVARVIVNCEHMDQQQVQEAAAKMAAQARSISRR